MTIVYFSTVVRAGDLALAGEVVALDWESKTILATAVAAPMDASTPDNNPRGGRRGGRGIWVTEDHVYAATHNTIECFDRALDRQRVLSNGLMAGLHEVHMRNPGRLWAASTTIDAAIEVDLSTGECTDSYWPREDAQLQKALGLTPLEIDKSADNRLVFQTATFTQDPSHLHLNAVASWRDELHALFSKSGVIVNLERSEVVMQHPLLVRAHDLVVVGDDVYVCSTRARQVCQFDLLSGRLVRAVDLKELAGVAELKMAKGSIRPGLADRLGAKLGRKPAVVAAPLFARGLQVHGDRVFVGVSPASILLIDWPAGRLIDTFQHSDQVTTAVHGLVVVGAD
ncbi:MAG TPA: hypothetical protein VNC61_15280 [Acidimicrobiales bacterium]|nr:hypothetical protein [Acidimicrobiales bacterium]